MLGVPVAAWLRFFVGGFVAGALLLLVPWRPLRALGVLEMAAAAGGVWLVLAYARGYAPRAWRRLRARARVNARRLARAMREVRRLLPAESPR